MVDNFHRFLLTFTRPGIPSWSVLETLSDLGEPHPSQDHPSPICLEPFTQQRKKNTPHHKKNTSVDCWFTDIHDLVGGIPTPLKNDGVRQLGWWQSIYYGKKCSKPPTSDHHWIGWNQSLSWSSWLKNITKNHWHSWSWQHTEYYKSFFFRVVRPIQRPHHWNVIGLV